MTEQGRSGARKARDGRALAVAELLRCGWTAHEVSVGLKVIDAGGGAELAMSAMREAQANRRGEQSGQTQRSPRSVGASDEHTPRGPSV